MRNSFHALFAALLSALSALAADPPPPNLENPIDYIAWVNAEYGQGIRDNAADLYRQAAEKFVMHQATEDAIKDKKRSEWTKEDKKAIRAWAEANAEAIELFEKATEKGDCYFVLPASEDGSLIFGVIPEYSGVRNVAHLIVRRSYLELLDGRTDPAVRDALRVLRAARHFQAQPYLIAHLVGTALQAVSYDLLLQIPAHAGDSPDYAALLATVRANDSAPRGPDRQFNFERIVYLDAAQRFLKDSDGDGKLDSVVRDFAQNFSTASGGAVPKVRPMTFEEVLAEGETCYAQIRKYVSMSPREVNEQDTRMLAELKARGPSLAAVLIPSLARSVELYQRNVVTRSSVRIVFGAYAFKAKNGRWPKDLKEATADESPGVRKDPFSGKELVYKLEGDSFRLYSVGEDVKDDGGKRAASGKQWTRDEDCDAVLWPLVE